MTVDTINIFQVINENDLSQIINNSPDRLVVIMFTNYTSFDKVLSYKLKKAFFDVSKAYMTNVFIYVDLNNFDGDVDKFTQDLKIPRFCFFYNSDALGNVQGLNLNVFVQQLDFINSKLEEIKKIKLSEQNNVNSSNHGSKSLNSVSKAKLNSVSRAKLNYEDQRISPTELKNIVIMKKKLDEKGGHSSLSELILAHVVQRESGNLTNSKNNSNDLEQKQEDDEPIDFDQMEQLRKLQILNATKNQVQMKLMNQIMILKKLKQRKEIEELKDKKREEEERERLEKEERKKEEHNLKQQKHKKK